MASTWCTVVADIGGAESWSRVSCSRYGAASSSGQRRLEDGQRLAELHRAALELAQGAEELLGGALLDVGHHGLGRGAAQPAAHPDGACVPRSRGAAQPAAPCGPRPCAGSSLMVPIVSDAALSDRRRSGPCPSQLHPQAGCRSQALGLDRGQRGCRRDGGRPGGGPAAVGVSRHVAGRPGQRQRGEQRVERLGRRRRARSRADAAAYCRTSSGHAGSASVQVRVDAAQAGRACRAPRTARRTARPSAQPHQEVRRPGAGPRVEQLAVGLADADQHAAAGRRPERLARPRGQAGLAERAGQHRRQALPRRAAEADDRGAVPAAPLAPAASASRARRCAPARRRRGGRGRPDR